MKLSMDFARYLFRDILWRYHDGGNQYYVCHQMSDWRMLPFMVIVSPLEGEYCCEVEGEELLLLHAGDSLIVPAGIRHKVGMPAGGFLHHAHIQFSFLNCVDLFRFLRVPRCVGGRVGRKIGVITKRLTADLQKNHKKNFSDLRMGIHSNAIAHQLLAAIADISDIERETLADIDKLRRLTPVLAHMEANISRPLTRNELAEIANLSPTRFHYVFEAAMECPPMIYLRRMRMERAQLLLINSEMNISQIAVTVGFPDIYHFSKAFKAMTNESPSSYRRRARYGR